MKVGSVSAPENPAGPFSFVPAYNASKRQELTESLSILPDQMRAAVNGLADSQLDTKYRNWTVRQICHHVSDSHMNSLVRFKWALTEPEPKIKAYDEAAWALLSDSQAGEVAHALTMLDGLHGRWCQLVEGMSEDDFSRGFLHPQSGDRVTLWEALNYYPWHGQHHTAQIRWLRTQNSW